MGGNWPDSHSLIIWFLRLSLSLAILWGIYLVLPQVSFTPHLHTIALHQLLAIVLGILSFVAWVAAVSYRRWSRTILRNASCIPLNPRMLASQELMCLQSLHD